MPNEKQSRSLVSVSVQTFKLLSPKQRIKAVKNIMGAIVQASLEVISLTAVIPLFLGLIESGAPLAVNNYKIPMPASWQVTLLIIIFIFVLKTIIYLWLARNQSQFVHEVFISFSEELYRRFYQQDWTHYLRDNSAEAVRKIKHTPSDFTQYVLHSHLLLITDSAICTLMGGVLIWFDYRVVLAIILLATPILVVYHWFRKIVLSQINNTFRELTPKGNIAITQGIDSFAEAKIYQKENFFIRHFMVFNRTTSQHLANLKLSQSLPSRLFEIVGILCFAAVISYSKLFPVYQSNVIVLLGLLSVAMYRIIPSLNRILINISQIQAYSYCVSELKESFASAIGEPAREKVEQISFEDKIQLKDISFRYSNSTNTFLLNHLNLNISKGDFLVIEGPSGVGKSTLIHLLTGLLNNYSGEITIDGRALSACSLPAWQYKLGFVPQAAIVLQGTILHNVAFGEEKDAIDESRVKTALTLAGLHEFVASTPWQLETPVGENGLTLSGGQRQRLILARALYRNPEVLLLDEVTNQLDEENKYKVLDSLKQLSIKGTTIVLASHDPAIRNFANRILVMSHMTNQEIFVNQSSLPSTAN